MAKEKASLIIETKTVGQKEVERLARGLKKVSKNTQSIKSNINGLRNVFFAVFGGIGIRQITQASDSVQLLRDRIKVFTGDAQSANSALRDLFTAAQDTNTSIESLAETYNRVALATKELGLNSKELIGFTKTLQNTFRLSGATIAESGAAAIQLSQGLASGQLRGQELRSVLEQNAVIGGILAKQLGTTRGQLIKFAESGKITSEVVLKALQERAQGLSEDAKKLGQTFEQTFIKIGNKLKLEIFGLNEQMGLSAGFATFANAAMEDWDNTVAKLAFASIPLLLTGLIKVSLALKAFAISNPFTLALVAATAAMLVFNRTWKDTVNEMSKDGLEKELLSQQDSLLKLGESLDTLRQKSGKGGLVGDLFNDSRIATTNERIKTTGDRINLLKDRLESLKTGKVDETLKAFQDALIAASKGISGADKALADLNRELSKGTITFAEYNQELKNLEESDLNKKFREGKITAQEYRDTLLQIVDIQGTFQEKVFTSIEIGAQRYTESIKTLTSEMAGLFESSFAKLETAIFDATKQGSLNFSKFTQAILDDLLKVIIRMTIVNQLASSIASGGVGGGETGSSQDIGLGFAKGGVFQGGKQSAFASGGIVNRPTSFPMSGGKAGLMGEAGPEAIVPLRRTSSGDLGVQALASKVIVNVNNSAEASVEVSETTSSDGTRVIDLSITRAVNNALSQGRFDKSLSTNFGLNRKGSR